MPYFAAYFSILFKEICKAMLEDFMEFVSASGYIIIPCKRKSCVPK